MVEVEVIGWEEAEETVEIEEIAMIEAGIEDSRAEEVVVMMTGQNRGVRHSVKKEEAAATVLEEVEEEVRRLNQTGAESHLLAALEAFLEVVAVVSQTMAAEVFRAVAAEVFLGLAHDEKYPSQLKDPN
jgi:predicted TIM-barrel fold metal-dependent hydrolase